jgi:hypothetical protein
MELLAEDGKAYQQQVLRAGAQLSARPHEQQVPSAAAQPSARPEAPQAGERQTG